MTTKTLPNKRIFLPRSFRLRTVTRVYANGAPEAVSLQTAEVPFSDRYMIRMVYPESRKPQRYEVDAFWAGLRYQVHRVAVWHMELPVPRGTMRGTPVVKGPHAQGATTVKITTSTNGETLKAGDWIGINGRAYQVCEDATGVGNELTVKINVPLIAPAADATGVVWERPTSTYMLLQPVDIDYEPGKSPSFEVLLLETP